MLVRNSISQGIQWFNEGLEQLNGLPQKGQEVLTTLSSLPVVKIARKIVVDELLFGHTTSISRKIDNWTAQHLPKSTAEFTARVIATAPFVAALMILPIPISATFLGIATGIRIYEKSLGITATTTSPIFQAPYAAFGLFATFLGPVAVLEALSEKCPLKLVTTSLSLLAGAMALDRSKFAASFSKATCELERRFSSQWLSIPSSSHVPIGV